MSAPELGRSARPGGSTGLTKRNAERTLQSLIDAETTKSLPPTASAKTYCERYLAQLETVLHRKQTTLQNSEIMLRRPVTKGRCSTYRRTSP